MPATAAPFPSPADGEVRPTRRISCEAVPASILAGAGMSRRLRPRNGAGESFVSFIRLFGGSSVMPRTLTVAGRLAHARTGLAPTPMPRTLSARSGSCLALPSIPFAGAPIGASPRSARTLGTPTPAHPIRPFVSPLGHLCPPNTADKLRSGARVQPSRRGHEPAPPSAERCRRKLRQLHPLVGRHCHARPTYPADRRATSEA